jgi:chemotaxis protein MotB
MAKDDFDDLTPIPRYRGRTVFRLTLLSILALAAAGVAGYYAWIYRAEVEAGADELSAGRAARTELTRLKERYAELDSKVTGSESKLKEAETQVAGARATLTATQEELETLRTQRAETEKRLAAFKELTERFQKMIDAGKIEVKIRDGVPLMALPAEVLFPSGSAALSRPGELAVMEVGITLKQLPNRRFMVVGHTDHLPVKSATYKDNWELSTARAVTVTQFLISVGLSPKMMMAAGHGEHDPVMPNKTKEGREKNRRIEIILMPDLAEMPPLPGQPEEKPVEAEEPAKPAEEKPAEEKPAEKPAEEKPAEEKPAKEPVKPARPAGGGESAKPAKAAGQK